MTTQKATIAYLLSEEGRKKSLLQGGNGKGEQVLDAEITPELLKLAFVDRDGSVKLRVGSDSGYSPLNCLDYRLEIDTYSGKPHMKEVGEFVRFNAPQTAEALIAFETARQAKLEARKAELQPEYDRLMAEYESRMAEKKAREEEEAARDRAAREAQEAERKAERERLEAEKLQWIQEHGSECLRDAVDLGYDCQRKYVAQRTDMEFPGYIVDFDDTAEWKSRSCPSREALAEVKDLIAKGYDAKVVWLTVPPAQLPEEEWPFRPCEAIVIRNYLGKYDLVKEV